MGDFSNPKFGDIDGDGDLDLVVGEASGTLFTFINNDAPTLSQVAFNLTGTNEDTDSTPVTVASLLASAGWADGDVGAQQGLAITGSTGAGWQYSVGGSTWTPVGAASATAAVLLGAGTQLRYAPDRANGETATLSFRAWDQTSGTASTDGTTRTADTSSNGGGTAFSTASSTASLVVSSVNDAPTLSQVAITIAGTDEDSNSSTPISVASLLSAAGWADVDAGASKGIAITGMSGAGSWQVFYFDRWSGLSFTPSETFRLRIAEIHQLRYIPDGRNGETAGLTFRAWDDPSPGDDFTWGFYVDQPAGGSTPFSSTATQVSLVVSPVNDAPSHTVPASISVTEDLASVLTGISVADVDAGSNPLVMTLSVPAGTLAATSGSGVTVGGSASSTLTLTGTATAINSFIADSQVRYTTAPNANGSVTLTVSTTDQGSTGASGALTDTDTVTMAITPVNDAPTLSLTTLLLPDTDEDTANIGRTVGELLLTLQDSKIWVDVDAGALKGMAVVDTSGIGEWQYSVGGSTWTPFGTVSDSTALLLDAGTLLRYQPDGKNGEARASLSFRAWDQTSGSASTDAARSTADASSNGGSTAFSSNAAPIRFSVTPVNDAPTHTVPGSIGVTEDVASLLTGISVADVDAGSDPLVMTLSVPAGTLAATSGSGVTVGGSATGTLTLTGSASAISNFIAASQVRYTTAPNANGSVTLTVSTTDQGSTGAGGALTDTDTVTLAITPVNDAPTTSPVTLPAMAEDSGTRTITQTLLLGNAFDEDGPALKAENLQLVGSLGSLVDNGNGSWNFTPALNDDTSVSFTYRISDGTDTVAGSATLDLTPVSDAPVAVNDSALTRLNAPVSIAVLANDSDIDGGPLSVSSVTPGTGGSAAVQPGGLTVLYTPNTGFSGFDSFNYTVSDGAGGSATASVRVLVASITGSNGNDTTLGTQQVDFVAGLDGADRIFTYGGADYVDAGRGADTITGGDGADTLLGGDGPDTFLSTSSELAGDQIDGGDGTDVLVITNAPASLPANFSFTNLEQISFTGGLLVEHTSLLDLSSLTLASGSSNSITGGTANSRITGTASADNIVDSAGNDDLRAAAGNDTIQGGFGQDIINGGTGNDVLYGGSATAANDFVRDIFVFNTPLNATTNVDQIIGFQANSQDRIELSTSIFAAITGGATSGLDADEFRSAAGGNALDGNDFILFDPATGNLFYDADGSGPGAKVLFATLVGLTGTLDATDFGIAGAP